MGGAAQVHADHRGHVHRRLARDRRRRRRSPGFWSKDEILARRLGTQSHGALGRRRCVAALLTAFYMTRQVFLVFFGKARWDEAPTADGRAPAPEPVADARRRRRRRAAPTTTHGHEAVQPHESPWMMTVPLVVLAVLRRRRRRAQPAVQRRARRSSTAGSSRSSARPSAELDVVGHRRSRARSPSSLGRRGLAGIVLAYGSSTCRQQVARARSSPSVLAARLVLRRRPSPRSSAAPATAALRRRRLVRPARHRRRGQRRRRASSAAAAAAAPAADRARPQLRARHRRRRRPARLLPRRGWARDARGALLHATSPSASRSSPRSSCVPAVGALRRRARAARAGPSWPRLVGYVVHASATGGARASACSSQFETGRRRLPVRRRAHRGSGARHPLDARRRRHLAVPGRAHRRAVPARPARRRARPRREGVLRRGCCCSRRGCIGVFLALDLFLFFVFFEFVLVPMYFLIAGWGHGDRRYAAMKFFLFTMAGSAFLFVGHRSRRRSCTSSDTGGRSPSTCVAIADEPGHRRRRPRRWLFLAFADRVRGEGAAVPVPHLAARRAHRGADRGLGDPGRRAC